MDHQGNPNRRSAALQPDVHRSENDLRPRQRRRFHWRRVLNNRSDHQRRKLYRIFWRRQHQLPVPRKGSPRADMGGLQTMPRRTFTNGRPWTKRFGANTRAHLLGPLPSTPASPATWEKLQWSVHGETPALTSTQAGSHGRRKDGRWGRNTAYDEARAARDREAAPRGRQAQGGA